MQLKVARKASLARDVVFKLECFNGSCSSYRCYYSTLCRLLASRETTFAWKDRYLLSKVIHRNSSSSSSLDTILNNERAKIRDVANAIETARRLDSYVIYRLGTFGPTEYAEAKEVLDIFIREKVTSLDGIAASFWVLDRVVRELAISKTGEKLPWACDPNYYNALLENWKTATPKKHKRGIILPRILLRKIFELSRYNPDFHFNFDTLEIIMDVAIKQVNPRKGPISVEGLVDEILLEAKVSYRDLQPYVRLWNKVMHAWSVNIRYFAPKRMWFLLRMMRKKGLKPNDETFVTFLKYWTWKDNTTEFQQVFNEMERENIPLNAKCLSYWFYVHLKQGRIEDAEKILWEMVELPNQDADQIKVIRKCTFKLFYVYRKTLLLESPLEESKSLSLKAESAFKRIENSVALNDREKTSIIASLIHLLSNDMMRERAVPYLDKIPLENPGCCRLLIHSYGENGLGDLAMCMYKSTLRRSQPGLIKRFNTIIEAWTESSKRNAVTQAFRIYRLLQDDPQCKILSVQPDFRTYLILLKSLAVVPSKFTAKRAVEIIEEMDQRYQNGDVNMKQTKESLTFALRSCLLEGDIVNAKIILDRLSYLDSSINVATVTAEILGRWEETSALNRRERYSMRLSDSARVDPNARLYHTLLMAWARVVEPSREKHIWHFFRTMQVHRVYPHRSTYSALFYILAKTGNRKYIEKGEFLLQYLESSKRSEMMPSRRFYRLLIKGWIKARDHQRALFIVERNINAFLSGNKLAQLKPGVYNLLFSAYRASGQLVEATSFIIKMHEINSLSKELPRWPNDEVYQSLLNDWKSSTLAEKATEMLKLEHHLERFNLSHVCASLHLHDDDQSVKEEQVDDAIENV